MFFGLSPIELAVLVGLALMLFGPDKLPGAVRESARIVRHIRSMGEGARADLLEQLGPELAGLAELDPRRLNPRTLAREKLSEMFDPLVSARDDVGRELREARDAARFDDRSERLAAVEAQPFASEASSVEPAEGAGIVGAETSVG